jgi:hypothetical protein
VGVAAGAQPLKINANNASAVSIFPIFFISLFSSIKQNQIEVTRNNGNTSELTDIFPQHLLSKLVGIV